MSAAIAIAWLSDFVRDLDTNIAGLNDEPCTEDELIALEVLGAKLADAARAIQKRTGSFKPSREDQAWEASAELRSQAQSTIASLVGGGKLDSKFMFRRNIVMIFGGPKDSDFDSDQTRSRKNITRMRCERIKKLSPDGVVGWAVSYSPASWAAGAMGKDIFECLIKDIEPESNQNWPPFIHETVQKLRADEVLPYSLKYGEFMNAIVDPSRQSQAQHRKRKHDDENQTPIPSQDNGHSHGMNKKAAISISDSSNKNISSVLSNDERGYSLEARILFDKPTLQRLLKSPSDIIGTIWFGSPAGYPPMISLRLPKKLGSIVKQSGTEIAIAPPPEVSITVTGMHVIDIGHITELIKKEGFGAILWNDRGSEGFVTIAVQDMELVAECLRVGVPLSELKEPGSSSV